MPLSWLHANIAERMQSALWNAEYCFDSVSAVESSLRPGICVLTFVLGSKDSFGNKDPDIVCRFSVVKHAETTTSIVEFDSKNPAANVVCAMLAFNTSDSDAPIFCFKVATDEQRDELKLLGLTPCGLEFSSGVTRKSGDQPLRLPSRILSRVDFLNCTVPPQFMYSLHIQSIIDHANVVMRADFGYDMVLQHLHLQSANSAKYYTYLTKVGHKLPDDAGAHAWVLDMDGDGAYSRIIYAIPDRKTMHIDWCETPDEYRSHGFNMVLQSLVMWIASACGLRAVETEACNPITAQTFRSLGFDVDLDPKKVNCIDMSTSEAAVVRTKLHSFKDIESYMDTRDKCLCMAAKGLLPSASMEKRWWQEVDSMMRLQRRPNDDGSFHAVNILIPGETTRTNFLGGSSDAGDDPAQRRRSSLLATVSGALVCSALALLSSVKS
jgi:hypothetical protein